jgi:hypothetical protein
MLELIGLFAIVIWFAGVVVHVPAFMRANHEYQNPDRYFYMYLVTTSALWPALFLMYMHDADRGDFDIDME